MLLGGSVESYKRQLNHLSEYQQQIMNFIAHNAKKHNLQYTMLAIAFKESQFGKYKMNLADPSCGVFHKLLPVYAAETGLKPSKWNESRLCEQLIRSYALSYTVALNDIVNNITYFKTRGYSNNVAWRYAIQAYNAGINSYRYGYGYYKEIVKIIKALKKDNL